VHALAGGIDAAMKLWCDTFASHRDRVVYYVYDHTAIGRSPHGKSFKDRAREYLINNGWSVVEVYCGDAPDHDVKLEPINKWLLCQTDKAIRMNEARNEYLKNPLKTDAILTGGKTKKDKSSEKSKKVPPEEATHYSDTFDQIVWGVLELELSIHE
jgi:hypothetical protein